MKKPLLACVLTTLLIDFSAFASDTLIYRSTYESRIIEGTINHTKADFLELFLAINADSTESINYKFTLDAFLQALDEKVSGVKSDKQKAKIIFKEVHSYFLRQYEENVLFDRVFNGGTYNCLTGSMLYSLVLNRYKIPYEIKEKPTHIYLVALPGTDNILFETTSPGGFYMPDERTKREFVSALVTMKLTTQEHVNSVGIASAFNEFYYNNQNISLQELAGLQYCNQAISFYQSKNIDGAVASAIKAATLYPGVRSKFLKTILIQQAISNSTFDSLKDIAYLAEFANSAVDVKDKRYVMGVFGDLLNTKLIEQGNDAFVTQSYKLLSQRITDEKVNRDITYNYQLGMAHWNAMKGAMDEALLHAEKAYAINSTDARLQDLVSRAVTLKTENLKGKTQGIEALDLYGEKFPFLKTNKTFLQLRVYQYAYRTYSLFLQNSGTEGEKLLALMEDDLKSLGGNSMMIQQYVGMAYAEAGAFHFRKKEYVKARTVLLKGLEFSPDHGELKERLRIVEDEVKARKY